MASFQHSSNSNSAGNSNNNVATDAAVQRLVQAIVGHDQGGAATSLARRVLGSQIGGGAGVVSGATSPTSSDLRHLWRRLERKTSSTDPNCRRDTERLYQQLAQATRMDNSSSLDSQVLPKVASVLVKLVGHKKYMLEQNSSDPTPTASNSDNQMSNQQRQQQHQHPQSVRNEQNSISNSVTPQGVAVNSMPSLMSMSTSESLVVDEQRLYEERKELEKEEALLLRECLYSLQGIDGERIRYFRKRHSSDHESDGGSSNGQAYEGIRVQSPALEYPTALLHSAGRIVPTRLGSGAMDALRICGEAGWLYNRVAEYVQSVQDDNPHHRQQQPSHPNAGVVARAFAWKLAQELRDYHSLLSRYEQQLMSNGEDGSGDQMTLRQLLVELRQPTHRLKTLALLTDGAGTMNGGRLLQALYLHSQHGDTRHATLVQALLYAASRPWYDILYQWTTQGILSDPHDEFFVTEKAPRSNYLHNQEQLNSNKTETNLWRNQYTIHKDQIPNGLLDKDLVQQAYVVGKGINFIRRCLLDGQWTMRLLPQKQGQQQHQAPSQMSEEELKESLGYRYQPSRTHLGLSPSPSLAKTLAQAAGIVHSHILRALKEDHHLSQHLFALKQFLLLGQGDFFSVLMDGLHAEFGGSKNASAGANSSNIYKHSVLAIVESALRSSNAKYLPQHILDRLQVELLMETPANANDDNNSFNLFVGGDGGNNDANGRPFRDMTVWDMFLLDYQVADPLLAIIHSTALDQYKFVFSFLFSLKKVEFMLNYTWRQGAILQHALHTSAQYNDIDLSTSVGYSQAMFLLRNIAITRQAMNHWIVNLKSYVMLEVIEGGWKRLLVAIDAARTLDEVIEAHDRYLNGIVRKCLLRDTSGQRQHASSPHEGYADDGADQRQAQKQSSLSLSRQLQILLSLVNEFCNLQESCFVQALQAADVATVKRVEAERRLKEGRWGFDSEHDKSEVENFFGLTDTNVLKEFMRISRTFHQHTSSMLHGLTDKVNNTTTSTTPRAHAGQDENDDAQSNYFDDASTCYDDVSTAKRFASFVIDDDIDPQRFLIAQLDHNQYYALQE